MEIVRCEAGEGRGLVNVANFTAALAAARK
jgi:hypothetical protein